MKILNSSRLLAEALQFELQITPTATDGVDDAAPAVAEASRGWADLPRDLLFRIFTVQPEPLHILGAEYTCWAWANAVRVQRSSICCSTYTGA